MILKTLPLLHLPPEKFMVIGSGTLDLFGIRESNDIDLLISPDLADLLLEKGWNRQPHQDGTKYTLGDVAEAFDTWMDQPLEYFLPKAINIANFNFASLPQIKTFKQQRNLPKDIHDIALIDDYLNIS